MNNSHELENEVNKCFHHYYSCNLLHSFIYSIVFIYKLIKLNSYIKNIDMFHPSANHLVNLPSCRIHKEKYCLTQKFYQVPILTQPLAVRHYFHRKHRSSLEGRNTRIPQHHSLSMEWDMNIRVNTDFPSFSEWSFPKSNFPIFRKLDTCTFKEYSLL